MAPRGEKTRGKKKETEKHHKSETTLAENIPPPAPPLTPPPPSSFSIHVCQDAKQAGHCRTDSGFLSAGWTEATRCLCTMKWNLCVVALWHRWEQETLLFWRKLKWLLDTLSNVRERKWHDRHLRWVWRARKAPCRVGLRAWEKTEGQWKSITGRLLTWWDSGLVPKKRKTFVRRGEDQDQYHNQDQDQDKDREFILEDYWKIRLRMPLLFNSFAHHIDRSGLDERWDASVWQSHF